MKIVMRGGLGNQLFQFCFIHGYALKHTSLHIEIIPDPNPAFERDFNLDTVLKHCDHVRVGSLPEALPSKSLKFIWTRFRERVLLRKFTNLVPVISKMELHEKSQFIFGYPKRRLTRINLPIYGYFQHWRFVELVWPSIKYEIGSTIAENMKKLENRLDLSQLTTVIHIRGGDFIPLNDYFGSLSSEYYIDALASSYEATSVRSRILVVTNDPLYAQEILRNIGLENVEILDSDKYSAWETLAIMSSAHVVITSNSTFSWWGGYLCMKNGGMCITPDKWYKYSEKASALSLNHPSFKVVKGARSTS